MTKEIKSKLTIKLVMKALLLSALIVGTILAILIPISYNIYQQNKIELLNMNRAIDYDCFVLQDGISWEWNHCFPECELKNGSKELLMNFHYPHT